MLAKIKDTTKASDDEIGRNLMGLARARPDVFGECPLLGRESHHERYPRQHHVYSMSPDAYCTAL